MTSCRLHMCSHHSPVRDDKFSYLAFACVQKQLAVADVYSSDDELGMYVCLCLCMWQHNMDLRCVCYAFCVDNDDIWQIHWSHSEVWPRCDLVHATSLPFLWIWSLHGSKPFAIAIAVKDTTMESTMTKNSCSCRWNDGAAEAGVVQ